MTEMINDPEEARRVNSFAVTKAIPLDELMTAVDVAEDRLLQGRCSKAHFSKGELYFEVEGHWIKTAQLQSLPPRAPFDFPPGQTERHKIRWAARDTDLEYRYLDIRLKEFITLRKPQSLAFSYELDQGSYLELNPDGTISMWAEDGTEILTIEKPFAIDSNGERFKLGYSLDGNVLSAGGDLSGAVYPIVVDPTYTVKTGTNETSTGHNHARKLARKSNGDLWCVYYRSDGTYNQIYVSYSTDGGESWNEEQVTSATANQQNPSIAIDSGDNVHVAWDGLGWGGNPTYQDIQYQKRTTTWQAQEGITDRAYDNKYANLIYALHPTVSGVKTNRPKAGCALVWSGQDAGGYKVEFFKSTDLEWEEAAPPPPAAGIAGASIATKMMAAGMI